MPKSEVYTLQMDSIFPNPNNKLKIRDLDVLQDNIKKFGVLSPVTVYWDSKKLGYVLISGHRRYEACKNLGLTKIPANVIEPPKDETEEFLEICAGNIARTSDEDINDQIKLASIQWESLSEETKKALREPLLKSYKARMKGEIREEAFRPKQEYIRSITGIDVSQRTISRKLAEIFADENEDEEEKKVASSEESKEKKKKEKTSTRSFKAFAEAIVTEGRFLTSEYAEEALDEETVADIDRIIEILKKYL